MLCADVLFVWAAAANGGAGRVPTKQFESALVDLRNAADRCFKKNIVHAHLERSNRTFLSATMRPVGMWRAL